MKIIQGSLATLLAMIFLATTTSTLKAEASPDASTQTREKVVIYLVDPADVPTTQEAKTTFPDSVDFPDVVDLPVKSKATTKPSTTRPADTQPATTQPAKPKRTIDDLIRESASKPKELDLRQQRIIAQVEKDQKRFIELLSGFLRARFDPADDKKEKEFNTVRDQVVKLVMNAPDQKSYYERLYLINALWLKNQTELARFVSLDHNLRDRFLEAEAKHRRIREIVTTGAAVAGLALGGYLSYKISSKVFPIVADEKGFSMITKYGGRAVLILVGAGVGAALGQYIGFLGSDMILRYQREYYDPVDGSEDLRDLLDVIDRF